MLSASLNKNFFPSFLPQLPLAGMSNAVTVSPGSLSDILIGITVIDDSPDVYILNKTLLSLKAYCHRALTYLMAR